MKVWHWIVAIGLVLGGVVCISLIPTFVSIRWILFGLGLFLMVIGTMVIGTILMVAKGKPNRSKEWKC